MSHVFFPSDTGTQTDEVTYEDIEAISDYLKGRTTIQPKVGVICGSGLGGLGDDLDKDHPTVVIPYDDIPKFPKTTGMLYVSKGKGL
jgi:purine-nucleoside phosphorylase